jgi:hypothetical protein
MSANVNYYYYSVFKLLLVNLRSLRMLRMGRRKTRGNGAPLGSCNCCMN